ncbi:uncharacterized protein LOC143299197 [Babylonia areolata]|uniref:uncharacterized protein LOC143299197 n=1 Tax=Babylonia areolata TaxID=304850 RepID=UPI003FD36431
MAAVLPYPNHHDSLRTVRHQPSPSATSLQTVPGQDRRTADLGSNLDGYQVKSGRLLLQHRLGSRTTWLPVFVRVYRNAFEHFAVVSRDQSISLHSTYVNLKTSTCTACEGDSANTKFLVVQNNAEGTVISFDARDKDVVSEWVEAFTSATPPCSPTQGGVSSKLCPAIPRSPLMPPLTEADEEE